MPNEATPASTISGGDCLMQHLSSQIVRGDHAHGRHAQGMAPTQLSATHNSTRASSASGSKLGAQNPVHPHVDARAEGQQEGGEQQRHDSGLRKQGVEAEEFAEHLHLALVAVLPRVAHL